MDRRAFLQSLGLGVLASSSLGGRWFRQRVYKKPLIVAHVSGAVKFVGGDWRWCHKQLTAAEWAQLAPNGQMNLFDLARVLTGQEPPDVHIDDLIVADRPIAWPDDTLILPAEPWAPGAIQPVQLGPPRRMNDFEIRTLRPEPDPPPISWGFERVDDFTVLEADDFIQGVQVHTRLRKEQRIFDPRRLPSYAAH